MTKTGFSINGNLQEKYHDVYTPEALIALQEMAGFNKEIKKVMNTRIRRRSDRQTNKSKIQFLDPDQNIPRTVSTRPTTCFCVVESFVAFQ